MTPEDIKQVRVMLTDVKEKKRGDTPLEAFDLVNKGYVDHFPRFANMYIQGTGTGTTSVSFAAVDQWTVISSGINSGAIDFYQNTASFVFSSGAMKCNIAGTYLASWTMSIESATQNQVIEGTFLVNNFTQNGGYGRVFLGTTSQAQTMSGMGVKKLVVGDSVGLGLLNHTSTAAAVIDSLNFVITRIA